MDHMRRDVMFRRGTSASTITTTTTATTTTLSGATNWCVVVPCSGDHLDALTSSANNASMALTYPASRSDLP